MTNKKTVTKKNKGGWHLFDLFRKSKKTEPTIPTSDHVTETESETESKTESETETTESYHDYSNNNSTVACYREVDTIFSEMMKLMSDIVSLVNNESYFSKAISYIRSSLKNKLLALEKLICELNAIKRNGVRYGDKIDNKKMETIDKNINSFIDFLKSNRMDASIIESKCKNLFSNNDEKYFLTSCSVPINIGKPELSKESKKKVEEIMNESERIKAAEEEALELDKRRNRQENYSTPQVIDNDDGSFGGKKSRKQKKTAKRRKTRRMKKSKK